MYQTAAPSFSALQRAEIAEINVAEIHTRRRVGFSALQRAEIAEIRRRRCAVGDYRRVSVLFNEPKLLKLIRTGNSAASAQLFQCSSTSRNC